MIATPVMFATILSGSATTTAETIFLIAPLTMYPLQEEVSLALEPFHLLEGLPVARLAKLTSCCSAEECLRSRSSRAAPRVRCRTTKAVGAKGSGFQAQGCDFIKNVEVVPIPSPFEDFNPEITRV